MNLFTKQKPTSRIRKQTELQRGGLGGEIEWKFKIDMFTLLYLKQNAFHETIIKAVQVGQIKRWSIFCLRYPVWCLLPHEAACLCAMAIQSCPTLSEAMTLCSSLGPSLHGISRQESWSGLPFPSRGDLLDPGIEPTSLTPLALEGWFFTPEPLGKEPQPFPSHVPWGCCGSRGRNRTRSPSVWFLTGW